MMRGVEIVYGMVEAGRADSTSSSKYRWRVGSPWFGVGTGSDELEEL